jgi:hypothetical protein
MKDDATEDPSPALREIVQRLRQEGLRESADEFEATCFRTYTTEEEWLGEVGAAIRRLRSATERALPREVEVLLRRVLRAVREVWPSA